jgi:putative ABC transport system permease protein
VLSDLWDDKTRTALVVTSIASGVFAVGMIITAYVILGHDINSNYASVNPANVEIWADPFYQNYVRVIEKVPGVENAEGRRIFGIRARRGNEPWQGLSLVAIDDFETSVINQLEVIEGRAAPDKGEALINRDFMNDTGFQVGDEIEIELPDGTDHNLMVAGLVTDQSAAKPDPESSANVYITLSTLRSFGVEPYFDRLLITVEGRGDNAEVIAKIASDVEDRVERHREVYRIEKQLSTEHLMVDMTLAILGVMGALGGVITVLSSSLIVNTLNALLTQQLRQIGVMKLIGGLSYQILGMYLTLIVAYGVIALVVAVPAGAAAGYALASFIALLMGAVLQGFRFIPAAIAVQIVIAFLIPIGAGFIPVNRGARTNVRRAISNYRPDAQSTGLGFLNRMTSLFRWISRPVLLSIRNTFRKQGRLLLTIFTLTVAGSVFIAVFNVRASMEGVMGQLLQHFLGDVTITFSEPYQVTQIDHALSQLPGVAGVEGWAGTGGEIWDENDDPVANISIVGPPQGSDLIDPEIVAGRWLMPGDKKVLVVSDSIYDYYPDLKPGDTLLIKIPDIQEEEWTVVGVFRFVDMLGDPLAYTNFNTVADLIERPNEATSFRLVTKDHSLASQRDMVQLIDRYLADRHYLVGGIETGAARQQDATQAINILVVFLLIMAVLTAFVGSIGLTGTMSMNVLERTREIGVMRAIGAVDFMVMQSVIIEGLVIGLMTWVLAIGLSFPISTLLLTIVGETMMGSAMSLTFTPLGIVLWLVIVIVLSLVASIMPARNAARLTINEVLAYE